MTMRTIVANADLNCSAGKVSAGDAIAMIETDLEVGELVSLLRRSDMTTVVGERDQADGNQDDGEPDAEDADPPAAMTVDSPETAQVKPTDKIDDDSNVPPADDGQANNPPDGQANNPSDDQAEQDDDESPPLADVLEEEHAEFLASVNVRTIAELEAWIATGHRPSEIKGIGPKGEADILAATGLSL
ncbi:hypothetical protein [Crateriforma conspicua]|uniref:Uncharacterized protein n=1 Tax=Crateriforma conspicua TaxID=2527996 RepID=A0A5C6FU79_9PLAN|nr:hypothetical protein [Crateriforma conspicua]TWU66459.1 hypothetical protein V7x_20250 [Crateriforma conspicua]